MKRDEQPLDATTPQANDPQGALELAHGTREALPSLRDLPLTLNHLQAGQLLGVSTTTFWNLRRAGVLDACKSPILNRWSRRALEAWSIHGYVPSDLHMRKAG